MVDETGDLKKGTATVGVKRQYTGTAGRIENAQVAVYLVYASSSGHAVMDRELYLPRSWTDDPERLQAAGVPREIGFATKPGLAQADDLPRAGHRRPGRLGRRGRGLRRRTRGCGPRLGGPPDRLCAGGRLRPPRPGRWHHPARRRPAPGCPARAWQQVSCGKGAKGHRLYDWAFVRLDHDGSAPDGQAGKALAHGPPQPHHRRAGLLPLLHAPPGTTGRPGPRRRPALDGGGAISRPARAWSAWTSTRSAAGAPGTAGPPWPCSPTPSWSWQP